MSEPSEPRAWLVRRSGASAGRRYPLKGQETRIGRDTAGEVVLDGEEAAVVSGRHAAIRHIGGAWRIHDLNSTNGTYVNGERVREAQLATAHRGRSALAGCAPRPPCPPLGPPR